MWTGFIPKHHVDAVSAGGETLYLQIDGYYGEVGDVEVSIQAAPLNSWEVNVSVDDLSLQFAAKFQSRRHDCSQHERWT